MTEQEDGLKELGLVVAVNKEEEIWDRVVKNTKNLITELEKQLEEIPEQIKVNRALLEFAKTKAPKEVK